MDICYLSKIRKVAVLSILSAQFQRIHLTKIRDGCTSSFRCRQKYSKKMIQNLENITIITKTTKKFRAPPKNTCNQIKMKRGGKNI